MALSLKAIHLHFQYQLRCQDACLVQIWWFHPKSVTSYRADKVKLTDGRTVRRTDGMTDRRRQRQYHFGLNGHGVIIYLAMLKHIYLWLIVLTHIYQYWNDNIPDCFSGPLFDKLYCSNWKITQMPWNSPGRSNRTLSITNVIVLWFIVHQSEKNLGSFSACFCSWEASMRKMIYAWRTWNMIVHVQYTL